MVSSDSDRRPIIGITAYSQRARFGVWRTESVVLHRIYVDGVVRAGGIPLLLPPVTEGAERMLDCLDGLVISGGPDIDPALFGQPRHPETDEPQPLRDGFEIAALESALERGIPVLGVCRGAQILNVAFGGTLYQHLPEVLPNAQSHKAGAGMFGEHLVSVEPDSVLAGVVGDKVSVRCHHHQAIDTVGSGLAVSARADDGTVEAVELADRSFVLGVQWHPETDSTDDRLFKALVAASNEKGYA